MTPEINYPELRERVVSLLLNTIEYTENPTDPVPMTDLVRSDAETLVDYIVNGLPKHVK